MAVVHGIDPESSRSGFSVFIGGETCWPDALDVTRVAPELDVRDDTDIPIYPNYSSGSSESFLFRELQLRPKAIPLHPER